MRRILGVLKATYRFFAGDAIILTAVVIAFVSAYLLEGALAPANRHLAAGLVFVALILLGLIVTLARERAGRPRRS
jgi:hypothetical protein